MAWEAQPRKGDKTFRWRGVSAQLSPHPNPVTIGEPITVSEMESLPKWPTWLVSCLGRADRWPACWLFPRRAWGWSAVALRATASGESGPLSSPAACSSGWGRWHAGRGCLAGCHTGGPHHPALLLPIPAGCQPAHRRRHLDRGQLLRGLHGGHQGEEMLPAPPLVAALLVLLLEATVAILFVAYPAIQVCTARAEEGAAPVRHPGHRGCHPGWTCAAAAFPTTPTGSRSTRRHACPTPVAWSSAVLRAARARDWAEGAELRDGASVAPGQPAGRACPWAERGRGRGLLTFSPFHIRVFSRQRSPRDPVQGRVGAHALGWSEAHRGSWCFRWLRLTVHMPGGTGQTQGAPKWSADNSPQTNQPTQQTSSGWCFETRLNYFLRSIQDLTPIIII